MTVAAIIVNYHTASFLPDLLQDLFESPMVDRAIVVDNSGEFSSHSSLHRFERLDVLAMGENKGFGAAVNHALKEVTGQAWVLVVNPDMRLTRGAVERLLEGATQNRSPLVGPRFFWDRRKSFRLPPATGSSFWFDLAGRASAVNRLDADLFSFYWAMRHDRFWDAKEPFFEPFLSGACLLVDRHWVNSLEGGLFDERFFLYYEDTDLCARAMKGGVKPLCVPGAEVIHYYDQARSEDVDKSDRMMRAQALFYEKYYGGLRLRLPESAPLPHAFPEMGELDRAPLFEVRDRDRLGDCFFEIAVNPFFVPFAQATVEDGVFEFPADIWDRLARGRYYARIRDRLFGDLGVWTWTRS